MASSQHNDKWTKEYFISLGFHWSAGEKYIYLGEDAGYVKRDFLKIYDHIFWGQCTKEDLDGFFKKGEWYDVAVQTTSKGQISTRRKKMLGAQTFTWWTEHPHKRSFLQAWEKKGVYQLEELTMEDWHKFQSKKKQKEIDNTPDTTGWTTEDFERSLGLGEYKKTL